jgi:N-acetylmannosamine-6-phosphate 2-epimerase / N-acetylmannosamine kinase
MTCVLAIDIGGTKTLAALVDGPTVIEAREAATPRDLSAERWIGAVAALADGWHGRFHAIGAAVTGVISNGQWSALNPAILPVPPDFPLALELESTLGKPAACFNDAHAAAWGEHRFGAGQGEDLFFLTVSSGIGGGAVIGGRLIEGRSGMAASAGLQRMGFSGEDGPVEDHAAGLWMARAAEQAGHGGDAVSVFAAAAEGEDWAAKILAQSAGVVANLVLNIQFMFDPPCIIIGGGIGLAPNYLDLVNLRLAAVPPAQRPGLRPAALGKHAGVIGAADLASRTIKPQ